MEVGSKERSRISRIPKKKKERVTKVYYKLFNNDGLILRRQAIVVRKHLAQIPESYLSARWLRKLDETNDLTHPNFVQYFSIDRDHLILLINKAYKARGLKEPYKIFTESNPIKNTQSRSSQVKKLFKKEADAEAKKEAVSIAALEPDKTKKTEISAREKEIIAKLAETKAELIKELSFTDSFTARSFIRFGKLYYISPQPKSPK